MKKVKKIVALLLTLAMVFTMSMAAFATEGEEADETAYTITINSNTSVEHTYEVYQIFTGTIKTEDNANTLEGIEWGNGISEEGQKALQKKFGVATAAGVAACIVENEETSTEGKITAHDFAELVKGYLVDTAKKTSEKTTDTTDTSKITGYIISGLEAGYYFIKDQDNTLSAKDDAYTSYMLKLVGDVTVDPKSSVPSVDKQVLDEAADKDADSIDNDGWGETADHAINEQFQFKLIATIPANENLADYDSYTVKFSDTMSTGVVFDKIDSVKVNDTVIENPEGGTAKYVCTATAGQEGDGSTSWTITIADILTAANITSADLAKGVTVEVVYTAHLNEKAYVNGNANTSTTNKNTVYLEYSNNPYATGGGELGKTPEDSVWVFTYKVENTKYANNAIKGNELAGAKFQLYAGEVTVDDIGENTPIKLYLKNGNYYVYNEEINTTLDEKDVLDTMVSSDDTGVFNIYGLDAGTYTLIETEAPVGYNLADPITIVISANHKEDADGAGATTTLSNEAKGMDNEIIDNSGSSIPETGGMGTTILYIVGAILVLGAGVVLVSRKRVSAK